MAGGSLWYNCSNKCTRDALTSGYVTNICKGDADMPSLPHPPACGIYKITNITNGNCYVGSSVNIPGRWRGHISDLNKNKHHSIYLQRAWNKYGADCFAFSVLEYCKKEQLIEKEQFYIDSINPSYNISPTAGSTFGIKLSDQTKRRISISKSGENCSSETRARLSASHKGKPSPRKGARLSEEARAKISERQIGKKASDETRAKMRASSKRIKPSEEQKAKLSAMFTGVPLSEEHKEKLSVAHIGNTSALGHNVSNEARERISASLKLHYQRKREGQLS